MGYKVLALDLDGTLTNSKKEITPATRAALAAAQEKGVLLVLASGRPEAGIWPVARELEMDKKGGYILAYNGGQIINCATGETVRRLRLPAETVPEICRFAREVGLACLTYDKEGVITENAADEYVCREAACSKLKVQQKDDLTTYIDYPVTKMMVVGPPEEAAKAELAMAEKFSGRLDCFRSEPYFVEVVPCGVEKATALKDLLERLGVPREESMACGDGFNDLPMLKFAGLGVAMANAQQAVKEAADVITLSNEEDGVAAAVQTYILAQD